MNRYYCVTSIYYANGRVVSEITHISFQWPDNDTVKLPDRDIYHDWFSDFEQAEEYAKNTNRNVELMQKMQNSGPVYNIQTNILMDDAQRVINLLSNEVLTYEQI